jgi:hypothetical protein
MSDLPAGDDPATDNLRRGDTLAMTGAWSAAIPAWGEAARARPELRPAVERRLRWFLAETGHGIGPRFQLLPLIALFAGATVLAAAFLTFAGSPGSRGADLSAAAAWVLIATAAIAAVVGARRSGHRSLTRLLERARAVAAEIDPQQIPGESR